jgi:hypothetical protein
MTGQQDRRFLIAVLVFGIVGTAAGARWLHTGEIVIRKGTARAGRGGGAVPVQSSQGPVSGRIGADQLLFYPVCLTWITLGVSMIALSVICFFSSRVLFWKLSSFSCLGVLVLGFATVGAAYLSGP